MGKFGLLILFIVVGMLVFILPEIPHNNETLEAVNWVTGMKNGVLIVGAILFSAMQA